MRYLRYLFNRFYFQLNRREKQYIFILIDSLILLFAFYLAFFFRLELFTALEAFFQNWYIVIFFSLLQISLISIFQVYRSILSYSFHVVIKQIFQALTISLVIFIILVFLYTSFFQATFPRLILFFQYFNALFLLSFSRFFIFNFIAYIKRNNEKLEKIMIYGAKETANKLFFSILDKYQVVAFIDDKKELQGQSINGIKIINQQEAQQLLQKEVIKKVIIAILNITQNRIKEIFSFLRPYPISIERVYNFTEQKLEIKKVVIEDLIGRSEVQLQKEIFEKAITGKTILITGAGGSIGSTLCKIIIKYKPKLLILLDYSEIALYKIENVIKDIGFLSYEIYLCDIFHLDKIKNISQKYNIDTIYHAAAYKHVNIIEKNPMEGIRTNVFGTWNLVQVFLQSQAKNFVLISTDKAVNPISVMGKSKKLAEITLQNMAKFTKSKIFTIVRFGNVINSSGSVIPRFIELIKKKQDLIVSHKNATRYFMTLKEASALVIQAGSMSKNNDIFHLDMGEAVKIYDIAYNLIRLYGHIPNQDIKIKIGKLAPNEKVVEENLLDIENSSETNHPKVFRVQEPQIPSQIFDELFIQLKYFFNQSNEKKALEVMDNILIKKIF